MSTSLARLQAQDSRGRFNQKITDSLAQGDGWLHKFCKDEEAASSTIAQDDRAVVTDPHEILACHSLTWSKQWQVGGEEKVHEALRSIGGAIARIPFVSSSPRNIACPIKSDPRPRVFAVVPQSVLTVGVFENSSSCQTSFCAPWGGSWQRSSTTPSPRSRPFQTSWPPSRKRLVFGQLRSQRHYTGY